MTKDTTRQPLVRFDSWLKKGMLGLPSGINCRDTSCEIKPTSRELNLLDKAGIEITPVLCAMLLLMLVMSR